MKKELVIIRIKKNLDSKKLEEITSLLSKQYNTGLLVLPEFCELVTIPQKDISDSGSINLIPCDDSLNRKTKNEKPKNKITKYRIGDKMSIPLFGFGKFTVTAQKQMGNRTLFLFDRCVIKKAMDSSEIEKNNFEETDLNRWLQNILLPAFPQKIKEKIKDLSIPTYGQIFGHDAYYNEYLSKDNDEQLPLMKKKKNRIVCSKSENDCRSYWLKNSSGFSFAYVFLNGSASLSNRRFPCGVRPVFWLDN